MHSCSIRNGTGNRQQTRVPDKTWRWILSIAPERLPYTRGFAKNIPCSSRGNLLTVIGWKGTPFERTI